MGIQLRIMARVSLLAGICVATMGAYKCSFMSDPGLTGGNCNGTTYGNGCTNGGGGGTGTTFSTSVTLSDSSGVATTSFVMGEPIGFNLEVVNKLNQTIQLQFQSAQIYDFVVVDQATNRVVWQWSDDKTFSQVATSLSFLAYASKSYSVVWNGVLIDGTQLPAGNYQGRGRMVADTTMNPSLASDELASPLVNFLVR